MIPRSVPWCCASCATQPGYNGHPEQYPHPPHKCSMKSVPGIHFTQFQFYIQTITHYYANVGKRFSMNVSTKYNKFDSITLVEQSVSPDGSSATQYIDKDKIEVSSTRCLKPFQSHILLQNPQSTCCQVKVCSVQESGNVTANTCTVCTSDIVC